ncbi:MAG: type I methionyl aminopeptidase [Verrucomicrobiota bacterium]
MVNIPVKKGEELETMREACAIAATILQRLCEAVVPGISTWELDQMGRTEMEKHGVESACYQYNNGRGGFPAYTCLSVNEEIVHGIGSMKRVLQPGDIITVDVCVRYKGFIGDNARTVRVGEVSEEVDRLVQTTEEALNYAIGYARSGKRVGDISNAVQRYVQQRGYSVVRDFVGHGVGRTMHEDPQIPNFGRKGSGPKLKPGMTLAIEPMVNLGDSAVEMLADGWTAVTKDRKPAAHFEHTVLISREGSEILTKPKK